MPNLHMSADLEEAAMLEKCLRIFKRIHSCGDFFAWQILCDVVSQKKDEDSFAYTGPGAHSGIQLIFGRMGKGSGVGKIAKLSEIIRQVEDRSQLNLPALLTVNVKLVEHTLCKFSKYCRFATQEKISGPFYTFLAPGDREKKCEVCGEKCGSSKVFSCLLCLRRCHIQCTKQEFTEQNILNFKCKFCSS